MIVDMNECVSCHSAIQTAGQQASVADQQCEYCELLSLTLEFVSDMQHAVDRFVPLGCQSDTCCPVCENETLRFGDMLDHDVLYCRSCRGFLIEGDVMQQIVDEQEDASTTIELQADSNVKNPVNRIELQRDLSCPSCDCQMEVHPYHAADHLVIDSCADCNHVWLDQGEMARLRSTSALGR